MPYLILCLISALLAGSGAGKYQASKPYSETVQLKLSEWRDLLKATRTTSRP